MKTFISILLVVALVGCGKQAAVLCKGKARCTAAW